jgi:hypothetical protein
MQWTVLIRLPIEAELSTKLRKRLTAANAAMTALDADRQKLDAAADEAAETAFRHVDELRAIEDRRAARVGLLIRETELRSEVEEICDARQAEWQALVGGSIEKHATAIADIKRRLADIGFAGRDVELMGTAWVNRHPSVHMARDAERSARERASDLSLRQANHSAWLAVHAALEDIRRRAAAV